MGSAVQYQLDPADDIEQGLQDDLRGSVVHASAFNPRVEGLIPSPRATFEDGMMFGF